ncbi:unnamed protein product [Alopecurus aequalis]
MEANGGGQGPEDYEMAMVVSARGKVAWVPAQAVAQGDALAAAERQGAWVRAEVAARTGWIPPAGMLVVEDHRALAVALGHGWVQGEAWAAENAFYLASLYLPAHEVVRCRRISRLWRAVFDTEVFRLRHHDHRSRRPMPLFLLQDQDRPSLVNLRAVDIQGRVSRLIPFDPEPERIHGEVSIHGSCAGILLISFGNRLFAFDPWRRRRARLPMLHVGRRIIGFYATTGPEGFRCKVLYHDLQPLAYITCAFWIYTLGTPPPSARYIGRALDPVLVLPPVFFLNMLHWLYTDNINILRFNTVDETFSIIPPPRIRNYTLRGRQLFEIDQHLAMTFKFPSSATVDVWVRSNATGSWSIRVFAVAQDRNLLVCCPGILLHCDALGTVLGRYRFTLLTGHTIQESLLLHPSILHARFQ